MNSITLRSTKAVITGMVRIIDTMNDDLRDAIKYQVSPAGEDAQIQITAADALIFYKLGVASHTLLTKAIIIKS